MGDRDRISELPNAILDEIFSNLDMKQVAQTCILSKRWNLWREPWVSLPTLNFDRSIWLTDEKKNPFLFIVRSIQFMHFVNQVLHLRFRRHSKTIPIHKLSLSNMAVNDSTLLYCIGQWITSAVLLSAEELHLNNIRINPNPPLGDFKTLQLTSVFLVTRNSLSLVLENVETLMIEDCILDSEVISESKMLNIDAPLLKHLVVKNSKIMDYKFVMDAPNLTSIVLKGQLYKDYDFSNMPSLISADVQVKTKHYTLGFQNCLNKILMGISNAKCLTLSASPFQGFPKLLDRLRSLHNLFHSVKSLKLTEWLKDGPNGAIAELLELFPSVENLALEENKETFDWEIKGEDRERQLSSQCGYLKTIETRNIEVCENGVQVSRVSNEKCNRVRENYHGSKQRDYNCRSLSSPFISQRRGGTVLKGGYASTVSTNTR